MNNIIEKEKYTIDSIMSDIAREATPIETYLPKEEKILKKFMKEENEEKDYMKRYVNNFIQKYLTKITFNPKKHYSNIETKLEKTKEQIIFGSKKMNLDLQGSLKAIDASIVYENIEKQTLEALMYKTKEVAKELDCSEMSLVKRKEGRNQIYKQLFSTKETFTSFYNALLNIEKETMNLFNNEAQEDMANMMKRLKDHPLIKLLVSTAWNKVTSAPIFSATEFFLKDKKEYYQQKADEIWKTKQIKPEQLER
ncbi:MAG: hypothetical protein ABIC91_05270 [Nanoarchaeota archaeon]|nr:hypothetical protein [Nanoarchaeota archaeon]MBU1030792.1 hypothetical protein [Nanoarchaeota archaeon]MBU1849984.1 hypothetical protein [Nanoarchaeota archaeon]